MISLLFTKMNTGGYFYCYQRNFCLVLSACLLCLVLFYQVAVYNRPYSEYEELTKLNKETAPWLTVNEGTMIEEKQTYRKRVLLEFCRHGQHKADPSFKRHLIVDDMNKVVYCMIPKTGSMLWLGTLLGINLKALNLSKPDFKPHHIDKMTKYGFNRLQSYPPGRQHQILSTYYKFMFVRHPIMGLLSAYRMFKRLTTTKEIISPNHIFHKRFSNLIQRDWVHSFPSYEEFAYKIATYWTDIKEARNPHWQDQLTLCEPCSLEYDFIGKHEYFVEEGNYVLRHINASETFPNPYSNVTAWHMSVEAFNKLSKRTQQLVQGIYVNDFQYLNYNINMSYS